MEPKRVNCHLAGCDKCSEGTYVGTNFLGYKMYSCSLYKRKHTTKNGRKCKGFRCKRYRKNNELCKNCLRGK